MGDPRALEESIAWGGRTKRWPVSLYVFYLNSARVNASRVSPSGGGSRTLRAAKS